MKRKSKTNWKRQWQRDHRRAFKAATVLPAEHLNRIQADIAVLINSGADCGGKS